MYQTDPKKIERACYKVLDVIQEECGDSASDAFTVYLVLIGETLCSMKDSLPKAEFDDLMNMMQANFKQVMEDVRES